MLIGRLSTWCSTTPARHSYIQIDTHTNTYMNSSLAHREKKTIAITIFMLKEQLLLNSLVHSATQLWMQTKQNQFIFIPLRKISSWNWFTKYNKHDAVPSFSFHFILVDFTFNVHIQLNDAATAMLQYTNIQIHTQPVEHKLVISIRYKYKNIH